MDFSKLAHNAASLSEEPTVLTADQGAVVKRTILSIQQNLAMVGEFLGNGTLQQGMAYNVMSITESQIKSLGELLNIPTISAERIEERHGEMRALNIRIRELEALAGQSQDAALVQLSIQSLCERLQDWWGQDGLGLVSDISFGELSCKAQFSCSLFGNFFILDSPSPISDKEKKVLWKQSLREQGFVITDKRNGDEAIEDCPESRQAMINLFAQRLPSATISQFTNQYSNGKYMLRSIDVHIRRIEQITLLPVVPREPEK